MNKNTEPNVSSRIEIIFPENEHMQAHMENFYTTELYEQAKEKINAAIVKYMEELSPNGDSIKQGMIRLVVDPSGEYGFSRYSETDEGSHVVWATRPGRNTPTRIEIVEELNKGYGVAVFGFYNEKTVTLATFFPSGLNSPVADEKGYIRTDDSRVSRFVAPVELISEQAKKYIKKEGILQS